VIGRTRSIGIREKYYNMIDRHGISVSMAGV